MEIAGVDTTHRAYRAMAEDWPEVEKAALEKAAAVVAEEARSLAPEKTGRVKENIVTAKAKIDGSTAHIKIGVSKDRSLAYAVPLEWGHVNRNGTVTMPRSFIGAAYEAKKAEAYDIIRDSIREAVERRLG